MMDEYREGQTNPITDPAGEKFDEEVVEVIHNSYILTVDSHTKAAIRLAANELAGERVREFAERLLSKTYYMGDKDYDPAARHVYPYVWVNDIHAELATIGKEPTE